MTAIFWRTRTLGDVVLSVPLLRALRRAGPVRIVGYPEAWQPVRHLVDEVTSIESPEFRVLFDGQSPDLLAGWLAGTERAIAVTSRHFKTTLETAGVRHVTQISPFPPPGVHMSRWLGGHCDDSRLVWDDEARSEADHRLDALGVSRPTIVHPGSSASWKMWPAEKFATLVDTLWARGHEVVLVEGPNDRDAVGAIQARLRRAARVLRDVDARALGAILARAHLYVGNDSGVTHLAAVSGAATIALFGPTDPANWAPMGQATIVRRCSRRAGGTGQLRVCDDDGCMDAIAPADVLEVAKGAAPAASRGTNIASQRIDPTPSEVVDDGRRQ